MNKVILMGRLTRDPEVRYTQTNNTLVASFSLAVNRRFARQGEERNADFFNIVAWSKTGEFCSKYFKKGQQVGVIGRLQTRTWDENIILQKLLQKRPILQIAKEMEVQEQVIQHLIVHLAQLHLVQWKKHQNSKFQQVMIYHFNNINKG